MRYGRLIPIAIVFVSFLFTSAALAQRTPKHQKWEYKIVNYCNEENRAIDIQQHIQHLGEEGWEMVSTDPGIGGEASSCPIHYFKRPKGAESKQAAKQQSQQPTAPQCSVPLDKAPAIRGLRLGMSAEELLSLFSASNSKSQAEAALKKAGSAPNYGLAAFWLYPYEANKDAKEKFAGIDNLRFKVFDGRVVQIAVNYDSPNLYPSRTIDEWVTKISDTFGLPGLNNWEPSLIKYRRNLKCTGLEVEASVGTISLSSPAIERYFAPGMTITDPAYRQVVEQRVKSDFEKKQREFVF